MMGMGKHQELSESGPGHYYSRHLCMYWGLSKSVEASTQSAVKLRHARGVAHERSKSDDGKSRVVETPHSDTSFHRTWSSKWHP